ncbi:substrate-binding periplasmic protein [Aeromonas diversa]|uniref:Solute-binding protein family 3/N-terminal domain-containing protein n=1 Tax=Aeromonas diversa CDC 2478-85 TaxID=1268237 RepID=N9U3I8_9GAMM|nr:ABC transporter substrate-binding protein [Aeromonas diversa]ENY72939.1 hypothetical protein G114_05060 [Aeromonas diversa CDC 2478-85]
MRRLALCLFLFCCVPWTAAEPLVVWNRLLDHPNPAVAGLLRLALDLTSDEYGPYTLKSSVEMEQGRAVRELQSGQMDVAVFAPDKERERTLIGVYVPLARGLLGWRVCLIRPGEEGRFAAIDSLARWQSSGLLIGQHQSWPDTRLLQANGLRVELGFRYEGLFRMLRKGRFDCFLRSVIEVEDEQKANPDLAIEPHLVFRYPLALMFFVSPRRPDLARRIEAGLLRARANGAYDRLFEQGFDGTIRRLGLERRTVLDLQNPDLPERSRLMLADPALTFPRP